MLPNNAVVREVFTGKDGVFETVQQGALLIDSSTIDPSVSQAMAAAASGNVFLLGMEIKYLIDINSKTFRKLI